MVGSSFVSKSHPFHHGNFPPCHTVASCFSNVTHSWHLTGCQAPDKSHQKYLPVLAQDTDALIIWEWGNWPLPILKGHSLSISRSIHIFTGNRWRCLQSGFHFLYWLKPYKMFLEAVHQHKGLLFSADINFEGSKHCNFYIKTFCIKSIKYIVHSDDMQVNHLAASANKIAGLLYSGLSHQNQWSQRAK